MAPADTTEVDDLIDRGLAAVESDDLEEAERLLDDARSLAGENHVRVLHLAGLLAWAQDDLVHATGYLMQAADAAPKLPDVYLDCAECLFVVDEVEEAEAQVRAALALPDIDAEHADEARLLLAQLRLSDDDPDEALEVLDQVDPSRKEHPAFLSTRGAVYLASSRYADAIADLERAIAAEPDDADLHYQLGFALEMDGNGERARTEMVRVLELDRAAWEATGEPLPAEPDYVEIQELRSRLEDVFEELPDAVLKLVAHVPITVQARPSEAQVREGLNPRNVLGFLGRPKSDDDEAELAGIVILRDMLVESVESDEDVDSELFESLMEEVQYFFKRDDIVAAEG